MNMMTDCLFIGHNEMDFTQYSNVVYDLGKDSPAYRDLRLNFIWHEQKRHTVTDIFNRYSNESMQFKIGDVLSTAISYLGTYLHRRGLTFDYINDFQAEKEELKNKLLAGNIRTIGITTTLYTVPTPILEICRFIRQYNKEARIIIGGPFVLNLHFISQDVKPLHNLLRSSKADALLTNPQGEAALVRVIQAFKNYESLDGIPNVTYWKNGVPATNKFEPEDNKLDENTVDWGLFGDRIGKFAGVRTCISCAFDCYFCGFNQRAGRLRTASLEAIERELDTLESIGTVKTVNFVDGTFNYPHDHFKDFLKMMTRKKYSFKWNSYLRCQFMDEETVKMMEESGCEGVYLGIESANQKVLNNMRKGVSLDQYKKGVSLLKKTGIIVHANFILGYVGETKETMKDTVNFINDYAPDFYRMQMWYLDAGTPIYKDREKYNIKGSNFMWSHDTMTSSEVCDYLDDIILNQIKSSIWLPVHNFNFHNLFRLIHMGMDVEDVKGFLRAFNEGIKEGIKYPGSTGISSEIIEEMKKHITKINR
ncbi:radical SAM PhpK family P-methyltransferase [Anaerobacterium chartisolvens]|uniref:Radical SAM PhpK family P-methyltransferase n=1 Tax=Anaerobacterium chartisolvens TaxID=1297424 RepID=A0A369BCN2_9FIRM|nr:radical SAM protein [Anaerobacterium chartisolvens]RCX18358.1 radical SAM PhpK family P-methyltransferase [Anaerobacterium chartisolvens]